MCYNEQMKICKTCNTSKNEEEFYLSDRKRGYRSNECKPCQSKRSQVLNRKRRRLAREFLWSMLIDRSCIDCGENDPIVLQFDHVRGKKTLAICEMVSRCYSNERIVEEAAKCEIRCANCHQKRTAKQFGWHKAKLATTQK